MSHSTRVFVVAAVLVLFALFSLGSAFDVESLLYTAEQKAAYQTFQRQIIEADVDVCAKVQCDIPVGNGTCGNPPNGTVYHQCAGTAFCNASQECETKFPVGHECQNSGECASSSPFYQPSCVFNSSLEYNVCEQPKLGGYVGDSCAQDSDCKSNHCNTTCQGFLENDDCTGLGQCGKGLYCFNQTVCMNITATGGDCESTAECGTEWTANECFSGKCNAAFTGTANSTCDPMGNGMMGYCGAGLFCDPSSSTCQQHESIKCDVGNDTQCESFHHTACKCNPGTGEGLCGGVLLHASEKEIKYFKDGVKCAQDHSCTLNPQSSCFMNNCGNYLDCFALEMISGLGMDSKCYPFELKCDIHDGSSGQDDSSDASAVGSTTAVVITAIAAMAALL